ncbi:hypothetical protein [Streptomyces sp. KL116D]|uniref:hypothetical protein n=1 Tax=Streptomyces sp. KL116D TaxID=3045152 RepID=UPI00355922EB
MTEEFEALAHLWDGTDGNWVVIASDLGLGTIYNVDTRMALLLEDEEECERAIEAMRVHGRPFLDRFPQ